MISANSLEILEIEVSIMPRILEIQATGGRLLWSGFPGLDCFWSIVPWSSGYPRNIGDISLWSLQKRLAARFPIEPSKNHVEADSGTTTKAVFNIIYTFSYFWGYSPSNLLINACKLVPLPEINTANLNFSIFFRQIKWVFRSFSFLLFFLFF